MGSGVFGTAALAPAATVPTFTNAHQHMLHTNTHKMGGKAFLYHSTGEALEQLNWETEGRRIFEKGTKCEVSFLVTYASL